MSISYFPTGSWSSISREERYFCQGLYQRIKGSEQRFVGFLNSRAEGLRLNEGAHWEVGFEVCLYRDLLHARKLPYSEEYSLKRTFDLTLFSERQVVIVEAKAQQAFDRGQALMINADKQSVRRIIDSDIEVYGIVVASSRYFANFDTWGKRGLLDGFEVRLSWADIAHWFDNDPLFLQADRVYKRGAAADANPSIERTVNRLRRSPAAHGER